MCAKKTTATPKGKSRSFLETSWGQGIKVRLPVLTVKGKKTGPLAVITAGQHGREINGIAAIEKVFSEIRPDNLKGTVVFLPVLNPLGVLGRRQDFPFEENRYRNVGPPRPAFLSGPVRGYNMALCWLKNPSADTYAFAVTRAVTEKWFSKADMIIDLHGWTDSSVPLVWGFKEHADMVRAFGLPWLRIKERQESPAGKTLNVAPKDSKVPVMVCELTPQNIVEPASVEQGRKGLVNSLKYFGMLPGTLELPPVQYEFYTGSKAEAIVSEAEGLIIPEIQTGEFAKKGETVTRVVSLETLKTVWSFKAPFDGLVFSNGRTLWGEDLKESSIVYPGFPVGRLIKVENIIYNGE